MSTPKPDAELNLAPPPPDPDEYVPAERRVRLTPASAIAPKPVHWLWDGRLAVGTLGLLAGREGIGKSTVGYSLASAITRGALPGVYLDQPRAVTVAATEDSWEHTIVPRLMATSTNLNLIFRVEVCEDGLPSSLVLPADLVNSKRRCERWTPL